MTDALLCPSGRGRPGALLVGIHTPDGVGYVDPALPVDAEFVATAGTEIEQRFRFAERCVERACGQWASGECGLIGAVLHQERRRASEPPACGIRSRCRWFAQRGADACAVCPYVVTDARALAPIELTFAVPATRTTGSQ